MTTLNKLWPSEPVGYPAPRKYVLVLSCVDARLLDDLVRFLDRDNLANRYYHVTLPGAALGLTKRVMQEPLAEPLVEQFNRWRLTFIDQVRAAVTLTKGQLTDIYIVQHEDCGAFRVFIDKDSSKMSAEVEQSLHKEYAHWLLDDLAENFCTTYNPLDKKKKPIQSTKPFIHTFYMDLRGHVGHLESNPDVDEPQPCPKTRLRKPLKKP